MRFWHKSIKEHVQDKFSFNAACYILLIQQLLAPSRTTDEATTFNAKLNKCRTKYELSVAHSEMHRHRQNLETGMVEVD